jgi:hypothetical protein
MMMVLVLPRRPWRPESRHSGWHPGTGAQPGSRAATEWGGRAPAGGVADAADGHGLFFRPFLLSESVSQSRIFTGKSRYPSLLSESVSQSLVRVCVTGKGFFSCPSLWQVTLSESLVRVCVTGFSSCPSLCHGHRDSHESSLVSHIVRVSCPSLWLFLLSESVSHWQSP